MNAALRILDKLVAPVFRYLAPVVIEGCYGGFFKYRERKWVKIVKKNSFHYKLYHNYLFRYGAYVGERAVIKSKPRLPHYLFGIFISNQSVIGNHVVIYQQVTIGSNALDHHEHMGAPTIGDNVIIGAGAKIIGNITIGNNCRIGANCVVTKDMPPNTTAVGASTRYIHSDEDLDNTLLCLDKVIPFSIPNTVKS